MSTTDPFDLFVNVILADVRDAIAEGSDPTDANADMLREALADRVLRHL